MAFQVNSPDVVYYDDTIETRYEYRTTTVSTNDDGVTVATPKTTLFHFRTQRKVRSASHGPFVHHSESTVESAK
jgi:hypothetical protein